MVLGRGCLKNMGQYLHNQLRLQGLVEIHADHIKNIYCQHNILRYKKTQCQQRNIIPPEVVQLKCTVSKKTLSLNKGHNILMRHKHMERNNENITKYSKHGKHTNINFSEAESPKDILFKYYDSVASKLNLHVPLYGTYKVTNSKDQYNVEFEYHIKWPQKKKFVAYGRNKKIASKNAAMECLKWLDKINKLTKDKRPIIYTDQEQRAIINRPVQISVDKEDLNMMNLTINSYKKNIENIIIFEEPKEMYNKVASQTMKFYPDLPIIDQVKHNFYLKSCLENKVKNTDLHINRFRNQIIDTMKNNNRLIIIGDTGCGKSTQIPQFIFDDFIKRDNGSNCNIIVAQPRRFLAVSLAKYVASQRMEEVGDTIGYHIRLESAIPSERGNILYCTYGIIIERLQMDPNLEGISHVILDEVHERSHQIDVLICMLKIIQEKKPDLKVIIMSATMNLTLFEKYLACPVIKIPGNTYPVKMHFLDDIKDIVFEKNIEEYDLNTADINYSNIIKVIQWILKHKPCGTILCFVPRWIDMIIIEKQIEESEYGNKCSILKLHSKISSNDQLNIYKNFPNRQKIILATNIAESGLTIPDVVYVIDSAIQKYVTWDTTANLFCSKLSWISKSIIRQRKGRAGRIQAGESYHLISKNHYARLSEFPKPEIINTQLNDILLKIKVLTDLSANEFCKMLPEPPDPLKVKIAIEDLIHLGALNSEEELTDLGFLMSHLQLPAVLAKAVILSKVFRCTDSVLSICALFSSLGIFCDALHAKNSVKIAKLIFHDSSDHISTLRIFQKWAETSEKLEICNKYNLDLDALDFNEKVIKQLHSNMPEKKLHNVYSLNSTWMSYQDNEYKDENEVIRGILYSATNHLIKYQNWSYKKGMFGGNETSLRAQDNLPVAIHTTSVNSMKEYQSDAFYTYIHRVKQNNKFSIVNDTSQITPLSIILFNRSPIIMQQDEENTLDESVVFVLESVPHFRFSCSFAALQVIEKFRDILWKIVDYEIHIQAAPDILNRNGAVKVMQFKNELLYVFVVMLSKSAKDIDKIR